MAEAQELSKSQDRIKMGILAQKLSTIAYGKGFTANDRQKHLERYGCATYNSEVLTKISSTALNKRGVIEIGAGNGQWARVLASSQYKFDIISFDNMYSLPLNTSLYHARTKPAHDFFSKAIMQGDERVLLKTSPAFKEIVGRVLLIVFPDSGDMARNCLRNYKEASEENDTFIYVGEGRGGANGDEAFFDMLEGGEWELESVTDMVPFGVNKGFEKMFVFNRRRL